MDGVSRILSQACTTIGGILKKCIKNKTLKRNGRTKKFSWTLSPLSPKGSEPQEKEDHVKLLKRIFDVITEAVLDSESPKPNQTCFLDCDENRDMWPTVDGDVRADAHIFLNNADDSDGRDEELWFSTAFCIHNKAKKDKSEVRPRA